MPRPQSALLAALDTVGLDDDELDIIRQEIEEDPEADTEEEDPETPTLSREGSKVDDEDAGNSSGTGSTTQIEDSPPPSIIPVKRKRISKKQRERDASECQITSQLLQ